jgi:hypothetical protein
LHIKGKSRLQGGNRVFHSTKPIDSRRNLLILKWLRGTAAVEPAWTPVAPSGRIVLGALRDISGYAPGIAFVGESSLDCRKVRTSSSRRLSHLHASLDAYDAGSVPQNRRKQPLRRAPGALLPPGVRERFPKFRRAVPSRKNGARGLAWEPGEIAALFLHQKPPPGRRRRPQIARRIRKTFSVGSGWPPEGKNGSFRRELHFHYDPQ